MRLLPFSHDEREEDEEEEELAHVTAIHLFLAVKAHLPKRVFFPPVSWRDCYVS